MTTRWKKGTDNNQKSTKCGDGDSDGNGDGNGDGDDDSSGG